VDTVELVERSSGHITPEELYQQVRRRYSQVNRSTVYRTLDLLEELGFISHAHIDHGAMRYHHASEAGHIHLVCHQCGHVHQIDDLRVAPALVDELWDRFRFAADLSHHSIAGRCGGCVDRPT
jgi:Fur family ferric uptake transcriptional regulator